MNIRESDLMPGGLPDSGLVTFSDLFSESAVFITPPSR